MEHRNFARSDGKVVGLCTSAVSLMFTAALAAVFLSAAGSLAAQASGGGSPGAAAAPAASPNPPAAGGTGTAGSSADDNSMFGSETVTPVTPAAPAANSTPQNDFLKYDQVKLGGQIKGYFEWSPMWSPAWDGSARLFSPASAYITPDLEGRFTITAKPLVDFGVNTEFRAEWPFTTMYTSPTPAYINGFTQSNSFTVPNISVFSFYSKFNWQNKVYFSFGQQPLSWGVSKGAFQPADDIFAVSSAIDLTNTGDEREGPISIKMTVPMSDTNNFYLLAGLPTPTNGSTTIDPRDTAVGVKGEFGGGNTEMGAAAYYSANDHPRALLMGTTGNGDINLFGEAILKYGSERDFLAYDPASSSYSIASYDTSLFFSGTAGGYYTNTDNHITVLAQYYYNGEGQTKVSAEQVYDYYIANPSAIDRMRIGMHYGFLSFSWGQFLQEDLTATVYAISNLSDGSGMVSPSLTWQMFDYMAVSIGATFTFGPPGSEFIFYGPVVNSYMSLGASSKPAAALNLTVTMTTEAF